MNHRLYLFQESTLFSAHFRPGMNATAGWARNAERAVDHASRVLAEVIFDDVFGGNRPEDASFALSSKRLDYYVDLYLDRWIETTALHASLYARTGRQAQPTIQSTAYVPPGMPGTISELKGLSGDISGAVGEGLFVATMREYFKLGQSDFVHIKPKQRKRFPDFAILNPSTRLWAAMQQATGNSGTSSSVNTPPSGFIPAEVKTVSTVDSATDIKSKLRYAIVQVLSFWLSIRGATSIGPSILFVAMRNTNLGTYDLALIHGQ